jgi:hypothetical protein
MACKSITIDGIEYLPKPDANGKVIKIVILQRGWVMVGYYSSDGKNCQLEKASVIRNWGTTKGLGEIAKAGPNQNTKLDPTNGLVEFHRLTEVATISCEVSAWESKLV